MRKIQLKKGDVFTRLTYVEDAPPTVGNRVRRMTKCICSCGKTHIVSVDNLVRGAVRSCGCLLDDIRPTIRRIHGLAGTREFKTWALIRDRCNNPRNKTYRHYGGRGIKVCARWDSFETFLHDMGQKPKGRYSIERLDNSLGYSPENCKWATPKEQANNRRSNTLVTYQGKTATLAQWASIIGIKQSTLSKRLRDGFSVELALTAPTHALKALQKMSK